MSTLGARLLLASPVDRGDPIQNRSSGCETRGPFPKTPSPRERLQSIEPKDSCRSARACGPRFQSAQADQPSFSVSPRRYPPVINCGTERAKLVPLFMSQLGTSRKLVNGISQLLARAIIMRGQNLLEIRSGRSENHLPSRRAVWARTAARDPRRHVRAHAPKLHGWPFPVHAAGTACAGCETARQPFAAHHCIRW
jgi:hypothetical protein